MVSVSRPVFGVKRVVDSKRAGIYFLCATVPAILYLALKWNTAPSQSDMGAESLLDKSLRRVQDSHKKNLAALEGEIPPPASQLMPGKGQHLLIDLEGATFEMMNDEQRLKEATLTIVRETGMTLLGINSFKLEPQGVSVVATLAESHLTIHTWPEHGTALVDLFTCGAGFNLQMALPIVVDQYGGNLDKSTYSVVPRGDHTSVADTKRVSAQFEPYEIMAIHKYKRKVYEEKSPFQLVQVWDHHHIADDDYGKETTRSLFLDGVIQSNVDDEAKYHETLVHPAFIASALPVKRVLIVGGGEGGTLRETLKWKSVEKVTMVELDKVVIDTSRKYLPSYSDCSDFGTESCYDDKRLDLYTEDFFAWFKKNIGNDICEKRNSNSEDDLFDVIILDLLDTEELPVGVEWAEYLYSAEFFNLISCAVNPLGVVVTNFGEGPFLAEGGENDDSSDEGPEVDMYQRKIKQIQSMSSFFRHTRVYDTPIASYRGNWVFAIGIVPQIIDTRAETHKALELHGHDGIDDYNGNAARVNMKIRRGMHPKPAKSLKHYDGSTQHQFQFSSTSWEAAFCAGKPDDDLVCNLPDVLNDFYDDEDEWFEAKLDSKGGGTSGIFANKDIKKGHITGLWDASTSFQIPMSDYKKMRGFAKESGSDRYSKFRNFVSQVGHDDRFGGSLNGGETLYGSTLSLQAFTNHACDHKPNFRSIYYEMPYTQEMFTGWHPVGEGLKVELAHAKVATRDIKKGEMITEDYSDWDHHHHRFDGDLDSWCKTAKE